MPLTVADVGQQIEAFAPRQGAAEWDAVGLQIGDPGATVDSMAVCHEVEDEVVSAIETAPVDLVVTYHPLLFHATRALTAGPTPAGRAYRLARTGASLLVVHTAFDTARGGMADALADLVGLSERSGFFPAWGPATVKIVTFVPAEKADVVADAMAGAGAGTIGNYSGCSFRAEGIGNFIPGDGANPATGRVGTANTEEEVRLEMIAPVARRDAVIQALAASHPYETPAYDVYEVEANAAMLGRIGTLGSHSLKSLAGAIADVLHVPVRTAGTVKELSRVAVLAGSGGDAIDAAAEAGADALVTGDVDHHQARHAIEVGLAIVDAGHAPTERPGVRRLYDLVSGIGPETVDLTFIDPNPWEVVAWRS
jgi:dinuclear metal center YbgI/SA1388 family protein